MIQKQRGAGRDPFGAQDEALATTKPLSVQGPDVHESMRLAGVKDVATPKERNLRRICCCGNPGCGIGPMTTIEEVR